MNRNIIIYTIRMIDELVLFQYISGNGSISDSTMLTNYFIKALICFDIGCDSIPFDSMRSYYEEISRDAQQPLDPFLVEGLILLFLEDNAYLQNKLIEIQKKRFKNGRIEFPSDYIMQGDLFSTMFCLSFILRLKNKELFKDDMIDKSLEWIVDHKDEINLIKDKALPIYLLSKYNYSKHSKAITKLLNELKPELISFKENFQKAVQSKDYEVMNKEVENALWLTYDLLPIRDKRNFVSSYLSEMIELLEEYFFDVLSKIMMGKSLHNNVIYFKTRIYSLYIALFSEIYNYDYISSVKSELLNIRCKYSINQFEKQIYNTKKPFIDTIKKWLQIDFHSEQISGGFSDSEIVRVFPKLNIPVNNQKVDMPNIIFKISEKETFEKELSNYNTIPPNLKQYFSKLSESTISTNFENSSKIFLIMEDLSEYSTLKELIDSHHENSEKLINTFNKHINFICGILKYIYLESRREDSINLNRLYSEDILRSIAAISKSNLLGKDEIVLNLLKIVEIIEGELSGFRPPFSTFMHGDLNLRNVMVKEESNDIRYKFIDFDNLNIAGDYVYDVGEFIVDTQSSFSETIDISKSIENYFAQFANSINDEYFKPRLRLSKFRSWLKLSKIYLNRDREAEGSFCIEQGVKLY